MRKNVSFASWTDIPIFYCLMPDSPIMRLIGISGTSAVPSAGYIMRQKDVLSLKSRAHAIFCARPTCISFHLSLRIPIIAAARLNITISIFSRIRWVLTASRRILNFLSRYLLLPMTSPFSGNWRRAIGRYPSGVLTQECTTTEIL